MVADETRRAGDQDCHGAPPYWITQPPSIDSDVPIIVRAPSEQRNTAAAPICAGVENSRSGCFSARNSWCHRLLLPARRAQPGRRAASAPAASTPSPGRWRCR